MDELSKYKFRDLKLPSGGTVGKLLNISSVPFSPILHLSR